MRGEASSGNFSEDQSCYTELIWSLSTVSLKKKSGRNSINSLDSKEVESRLQMKKIDCESDNSVAMLLCLLQVQK